MLVLFLQSGSCFRQGQGVITLFAHEISAATTTGQIRTVF